VPYFVVVFLLAILLLWYVTSKDLGASREENNSFQKPVNFSLRNLDEALCNEGDKLLHVVVVLQDLNGLSLKKVRKYMSKRWSNYKFEKAEEKPGSRKLLRTSDAEFVFEVINYSSDNPTVLKASKNAYYWKEVDSALQSHRNAVLITVDSQSDTQQKLTYLTHAVAAFVKTCPTAVGAIFCDVQGISRENILEYVSSKEDISPIKLWVACRTFSDDQGRINGYTIGLARLGAVEFEAVDSPENTMELRSRLESLAVYSLVSGATIFNGDTTGVDVLERIKLNKRPSALGNKGWVFQLSYLHTSFLQPWQ
jgi:hypothetical protein